MSEYKAGDKFVIEIEEIYNGNLCKHERHMHLYRIKGFNSLVFDENGLEKLTPYDEIKHKMELIDELKRDEYNRGLNDAWELAKKIVLSEIDGGMSAKEFYNIFDKNMADEDVLKKFTPQEALAKLEAYEKSKKEVEEKFKVGDIVTFEDGTKGMVMDIDAVDNFAIFTDNGCIEAWIGQERVTKTGKHIDISALLEEIGEE